MTEHPRFPMREPDREGQSLFERAERAFELRDFRPAPVPADLAPVPMKPARRKKPAQPVADHDAQRGDDPSAVEPRIVPAPSAADLPVPSRPAGAMQLEQTGERALRFSGPSHPIDRAHLRRQGLIEPEGAVTGLFEEFRIVKRQLLTAARERMAAHGTGEAQRILICSPLPGEGKTYCAVNLAIALAAEKDSEVVLVDADFAKPSVLSALGLPGGPGFMDALADPDLLVETCVMGTDIPGLHVLPAGNQTNSDSEFLSSVRTHALLDRLTRGAPERIIIFDSPPALAASPAAELAKYCGQAVLVVRADSTGQTALEDAYQLLSACPEIKLLLNAAHFSPSGRRFGSYYGYEG